MSLAKELESRGFIHQFSAETLAEIVDGEKRVVYHGIDPTADSAHAGNFVNWMLLKHLANNGHKILFLVGGATGMIGDPKPDAERQLKSTDEVFANVEKIKKQAEDFFEGVEVQFVNNYDWFKDIKLLDFLRDIGKHYTVNDLIKKDAIATRLSSDTGLSYTEFAYPLIQGYDYYELFQSHGCTLQVGGSDQWGNMISGVELIRRKLQKEAYVMTSPLVVDKTTGKKFGKSEGNAVWLSAEKTSPYKFYQFWLNVSDDNVVDYLKLFTLLSLDKISDLSTEVESNPGQRQAQKTLAFEVTKLVHGEKEALSAEKVSSILFGGGNVSDLEDDELKTIIENAPNIKVKEGDLMVDVLVDSGLAKSKREARTFIESGAVSVNENKITSTEATIDKDGSNNGVSILRRGKKNLSVIEIE